MVVSFYNGYLHLEIGKRNEKVRHYHSGTREVDDD
jgi:hypothetical protein